MPRPPRERRDVRAFGISIPCNLLSCGRWSIDIVIDRKRRRWTFNDFTKAKAKAREIARKLTEGNAGLVALTPGEERAALEAVAAVRAGARRHGQTVADVAGCWYASKVAASGGATKHAYGTVRNIHRALSPVLQMPMATLSRRDLEECLAVFSEYSPQYRYNLRRDIVALWRWAGEAGAVARGADGRTVAESIPKPKLRPGAVGYYTPDDLLEIARATREEMLPWLAVQAFAGVRRHEIQPDARSNKPPLTWDSFHLDRETPVIDIPAACAKTGRRRIVPALPALLAWLRAFPPASDTVAGGSVEWEIKRVKKLGVPWTPNALRHSFGTYRVAAVKNPAQVAMEMGNSPAMIARHYDAVETGENAAAWFTLEPPRRYVTGAELRA